MRLVKASLGFEEAGKYEFVNRGIGGNRIVDIYARIKNDIITLKPDVMSIAKCVPELSTGYKNCYWNARPILSCVKLDEIGSMN